MSAFLTSFRTSSAIEEIILKAQKEIVLVSPCFNISTMLFERLKDASEKGVKIKIVYRKDELSFEQRNKLVAMKNLTFYFLENLRAKCYYNEKKMVITSMDISEFAEKDNREMGVLLTIEDDKEVFQEAAKEIISIIKNGEKKYTGSSDNSYTGTVYQYNAIKGNKLNNTNWRDIITDVLSEILEERFRNYDRQGEVYFKSRSHTFNCYISCEQGKQVFNVSKILNEKYCDLLMRYEHDIRKKTKLDFQVNEAGNGQNATSVLRDNTGLQTSNLDFVHEDDLTILCNAITQFASIFASLKSNFITSNVS